MSNDYKHRRFEEAVKHGTDEDIREAARNLSYPSFETEENAKFMAEQLREHKRSQVRGFGDETKYDGVNIRTGSFPRIRVEPEPEEEYHPPQTPTYAEDYDDDEDEDYDSEDQSEDFNDDDEEDWEDE